MALTKNKYLRNLKQNAEDTYRINQGMNNTRVYLERQLYGLRVMGMSIRGLDNLSGQLTLLCFLAGGAAAFLSYWYRSDNYYIVLYGTVGILSGMLTMLVDYGVNLEARRQQLLTCLQDYMENVMLPRMNREGSPEGVPAVTAEGSAGNRRLYAPLEESAVSIIMQGGALNRQPPAGRAAGRKRGKVWG